MKQVIMFHVTIPCLSPPRTYSRGQVFILLPQETALICIKVTPHRTGFYPQQPYRSLMADTICYLVKNTTGTLLQFRNASLQTLLSHPGIHHTLIHLSSEIIIQLHKKWIRGCRVWYPLRKMFVMSQHSNIPLPHPISENVSS